ncbi:MAG: 6-hydroxymethylpterin diphosphokinase MptE-like protein, partial [Exilispira sp.]
KPVLNIQIPSYNNLVNQNTLFLYQYFSKKFNDLISDYSTHIIMLPKQIINTIENLKYINKTLYILKDNEIYTLVISAGPSLNDKIDLIKKIQKNVYIIAVDTALRFLLKNDIIPDLVIAIDPQTINFLDFVGIQNLTKTILAIEISSSYKIAEKYSNYKYLTFFIGKLPSSENKDSFSYVNPLSSFIAKNLSLFSFPVYGNVGIAAISLASLISNNLILAGFDGSFENLIYHCKETMDINYYLSYQNYLNKALSSLTKDSLKILINNGKRSSIQLEKNNDIFKKYFPDKNIIQINNLNNEYLLIEKIKKSRKVDLIGVKKIDNIIINYENKTNTNVDLKNQILQAIDKSFVYFEAGKIKNKSKIDNLIKRLFNLIN